MKKTYLKNILLLVAVTLFSMPAFAKEPSRTIEGVVTKVNDGDTIQVTDDLGTKVKVRFYGMDAPETEKGNKRTGEISKPGQPFGENSFQALRQKVDRQRVLLEVMAVDQYKRTVAIVWLGNRNINREMVADGWAWAYRQYLDRAHAPEYIYAEEQARSQRKGIWQQGNDQPPWEFRKAIKSEK